jgi:nucleotide-binding universal stress UspA family protein
MKTILAGLDSSAADRPVIETALGLAEVLRAAVDAVHVDDDATETAGYAAARAGLDFRRIPGPVVNALLAELAAPDVSLGVLGARGLPIGKRPAGSTVLGVLRQTAKPVVVVPPEAFGICPRPFRRFLVPLDGTKAAALCAAPLLDALASLDSETVVLHVFGERTLPLMVNNLGADLQAFGVEFLARHLPGRRARFEWRTGHPAGAVVDACNEQGVDLVIVSWAQLLEGHADVIRALLSRCEVPVLVVPLGVPAPQPRDSRLAMSR